MIWPVCNGLHQRWDLRENLDCTFLRGWAKTPMLANLKPAVASVTEIRGKAMSEDRSFVAHVAKQNVLLNMEKILQHSPIIAEMVANEEVKIVGCMYDLESGVVDFYD
jgi:carbonic anhydrase